MANTPNTRSLVGSVLHDFRSSWKPLALTDIAFKIIAFVALTPLVALLFRVLIATSGSAVLSDMDIVFFFLGPVGWLCIVVVGSLWLGIVALEQAALMGIICATIAKQHATVLGALRFAAAKAWPVLQVTARMVAWTLLAIVPFLVVAAVVYHALLTDFDINYYLKEKPPVFLVALGIAGVIVAALACLLLRLFTSWFFALPLVLFEDVPPSDALRGSAERAHGHRRAILLWLVGWGAAMAVLSALATGIVVAVARLLIPGSTDSLRLLTVGLGVTVLLWVALNVVVNLLSTTTFASLLFNLYQACGSGGENVARRLDIGTIAGNDAGLRITRRRLIGAGVIGMLVAIAVIALALQTVRLEDNVEIMAHRGSSKAAPENSMAAFKKAIEDGADWVELDVQETADGEIVVFHDSDFMKVAGNDLKIWDATMDDLRGIDIGSKFSPEFKDERVPTLAAVLNECKGKIGVNIELKYYGHDQKLEQRVADIVESCDMVPNVMLMSLKADRVKKMKALRPDWKVGLLMSVSAGDLKDVEADFLAVNAAFADRPLIRAAHSVGKKVYVWTVNDAPTMSTMIGRGVDGLLTDKPALARSVLDIRSQMSAPQRLLLELAGLLGMAPEIGNEP